MRYIVHLKAKGATMEDVARLRRDAVDVFDKKDYIVVVSSANVELSVTPQWVYTMQVGWTSFAASFKKLFMKRTKKSRKRVVGFQYQPTV